jgi:hypothetical protein
LLVNNSLVSSSELRNQLTALKSIDPNATTASSDLINAFAGTAVNPAVNGLN